MIRSFGGVQGSMENIKTSTVRIKKVGVEQVLALRQLVLWPDKPLAFCRVPEDDMGWHYAAVVDNDVKGVASLFWGENGVRLRKFAVHPDCQRMGIGRELMKVMLADIEDQNQRQSEQKQLYLDARESAMEFYLRFGLEIEGERFYKETEPYFRMVLPGFR